MSNIFRVLFLLLVLGMFVNGRPPAKAQSSSDALQDERISQLDQHIKNHETTDDARVQQLSRDMREVAAQVSEMRGEERGLFLALTGLQLLAIFFPWLSKKRGA